MNSPKVFSLQNKFILIAMLNAIIPLLLVVGLTYTKSTELVERQVSQSNYNTVAQISDNINLVFQDAKNSSVFLLQNHEFMNYLRLSRDEVRRNPSYALSAQNFINSYLAFNTNIHSIYLQSFNGLEFDSASAQNTIDLDLRRQLSLLRGEGILISDVITNYNGTQTKVFSFIKIIKDTENLSSDLAILKINISEAEITSIYEKKLLSQNSKYFIINENNTIITAFDKSEIGTNIPTEITESEFFQKKSGFFKCLIGGSEFVVSYDELMIPKWKIINLVPLYELSQDMRVIRNITMLAIILSLLFCILAILTFSVKTLKPLRKLRHAMTHLENENYDVIINVNGNDEIALLADSFNKMSRKMSALINEVLAVQIKQKEAELKALHAQINPHFLFNTLDMIYWKCKMENAKESAVLIQTLSRLFRLSLNNGAEFTTLGKEIEYINLYMAIQQKRFEGILRFELNVQEDLMECKVIKLILQPIVENAIIHGIEKNGGSGIVEVTIFQQEDILIYNIRDDGAGAVESEVYNLLDRVEDQSRGFAINNVNERIKIHYNNTYGISFQTSPGEGMLVTVKQPLLFPDS